MSSLWSGQMENAEKKKKKKKQCKFNILLFSFFYLNNKVYPLSKGFSIFSETD